MVYKIYAYFGEEIGWLWISDFDNNNQQKFFGLLELKLFFKNIKTDKKRNIRIFDKNDVEYYFDQQLKLFEVDKK